MNKNEKQNIINGVVLQINSFLYLSKTELSTEGQVDFLTTELSDLDLNQFLNQYKSNSTIRTDIDYKVHQVENKNDIIVLFILNGNDKIVLDIDIEKFNRNQLELFISSFSY